MTLANRRKPRLHVRLASPRGFCAGVTRAIEIVERALAQYGPPIYVRHEIVHNARVVARLADMGAIFVDELAQLPRGACVIFSAHGVSKQVRQEAKALALRSIDATCPLVTKVHKEAERFWRAGAHILLVGHHGHPEVSGTMGQLPSGAVSLIETTDQAHAIRPPAGMPLALLTQTTLSVDDTKAITAILHGRFDALQTPSKSDICYATTNRQAAVKAIAQGCDVFIVLGGQNSSNSQRLVETAQAAGSTKAILLTEPKELDWQQLANIRVLGLSSGASTPNIMVQELLEELRQRFQLDICETSLGEEHTQFPLPKDLTDLS